MLKFKADIRTLFFMLITTSLLILQWNLPDFHLGLFLWACLMAVVVTTIAHNHNHLGIWNSEFLNRLTDYWLTLFYGYPAFAWIPTHNMNHHVHNNKEEDYTATYKVGEGNNLLTLLYYPIYSGMVQQKANKDYLKMLWNKDRKKWVHSVFQIVILLSFYAVLFAMDWKKALLFVFIPHQVGLNMVLVFNYIQHIHADELSRYNHSRNFVSPVLNAILLNNGFHTVHHMHPRKHWSINPNEHTTLAPKMDPTLNEKSLLGFMFKTYILSIFMPKYRSVPRRPASERRSGMTSVTDLEPSFET